MNRIAFGIIAILSGLIVSCATPIKKEISEKYIGKSGYFYVGFDRLVRLSGVSDFKRCDPIQIMGMTDREIVWDVDIKQGDSTFKSSFARIEGAPTPEQQFIDSFYAEMFLLEGKKAKRGAQEFGKKELLCKNLLQVGMTKNDVLFVLGYPKKINTTHSKYGSKEQWVYEKAGGAQLGYTYVYLANGVIEAIQD